METHNPGTKMPNYSPLWSADNHLPRDRATINAWARALYALEPDINRIINQHALIITSTYELIDGQSNDANQLIKGQLDDLHIPSIVEQIVQEYFIIGEVFIYSDLDEGVGKWSRLIIQNPDYIVIKRSTVASEPNVMLRPDENLRRICFSDRPEDACVRNLLSATIVDLVKNGKNIPLDPFYTLYIAHKTSPYEIRGSSFIMPLFETARTTSGFPTTDPEERRIVKQTLWDITAADKMGIAKDVLFMRYSLLIEQLEYWFNRKLIEPVAKIHGFYAEKQDGQKLSYPQVRFDKAKLKKVINKIK